MELGAAIRVGFAARLLLGAVVRARAALHEGIVVGHVAASEAE